MCYRIVTMAVLPLLLTRFSKIDAIFGSTADQLCDWLACDASDSVRQVDRGDAIAGKPAPTLTESVLREAFQAYKRAGCEPITERLAVG